MNTLITGGLGVLGAEVAHQMVAQGHKVVVVDIGQNTARIDSIRHDVELIHADVSHGAKILDIFQRTKPEQVIHFAAVLGPVSEQEPEQSFQTNIVGTRNVFEAARLNGVRQVLFASSTGTFGGGGPLLSDTSPQRPGIIYGWEKLYGEGLVAWYKSRYGLDCRGLRYAQVTGPNCDTVCWSWTSGLIEDAILHGRHKAGFANPDSAAGLLYIRDAGRATLELLAAPVNRVRGTYNLNGAPGLIYAGDLETALKNRIPGFSVIYAGPAGGRGEFRGYDDSRARHDWNWQPQWSSLDVLLDQFGRDVREAPERFGMKVKSTPIVT